MDFRFRFICMIALSFAASVFAQQPAASNDVKTVVETSFPYIAEIVADDVYIRSGPGTQYYSCGKLQSGHRVKVVSRKFSWSQIAPPEESFSWISKQYVTIDPNAPQSGVVTGDNVRVYAGSPDLKPIHSTTVQPHRNKGDIVKVIASQEGDYYKIVPPMNAYLWVSTQYLEMLGAVGQVPIEQPVVKPKEVKVPAVSDTGKDIIAESGKLKEYRELEKQVKAELAKPFQEQEYSSLKAPLGTIAEDDSAGKASRYAKFTLKQIERYEIAVKISKELDIQDRQIKETIQGIENARKARLDEFQDTGIYTAVGKFQSSTVYAEQMHDKYYRLLNDDGKTICYAVPVGNLFINIDKFIDKKVGLTGTIKAHPQTASALVVFENITELK